MESTKISVVLPVRDQEGQIAARVIRVLGGLLELTQEAVEIIVVDDGSRDGTPDVLQELCWMYPQVRVVGYERPRGIEAAGQTGLERAAGELVFIQESEAEFCMHDLGRLLKMSDDKSIVAARAESSEEPIAPSLLRRLREWGTDADEQLTAVPVAAKKRSLQMIRRPHLQRLAAPEGNRYQLEGHTSRFATLQRQ